MGNSCKFSLTPPFLFHYLRIWCFWEANVIYEGGGPSLFRWHPCVPLIPSRSIMELYSFLSFLNSLLIYQHSVLIHLWFTKMQCKFLLYSSQCAMSPTRIQHHSSNIALERTTCLFVYVAIDVIPTTSVFMCRVKPPSGGQSQKKGGLWWGGSWELWTCFQVKCQMSSI